VSTNAASESNTPTRYDQSQSRHATMQDVKKDLRHLKHDAADIAADAVASGKQALQDGADATVDAGKKVAETMGDTHKAFCRHVAEHPTSSVLIAMGVGAMLSRLLPRR